MQAACVQAVHSHSSVFLEEVESSTQRSCSATTTVTECSTSSLTAKYGSCIALGPRTPVLTRDASSGLLLLCEG